MNAGTSPRAIVDRQLQAYNARDLAAYCALFADEAVIRQFDGPEPIARGIDAIRRHYRARFDNPRLHCTVKSRIEFGPYVIDHEQVAGLAPNTVELAAVYEVRDGLIQSVHFIRSGV